MNKKRKINCIVPRSEGAMAAHLRGGAGKHDSRPNRQRTRATAKRAAMRDAS